MKGEKKRKENKLQKGGIVSEEFLKALSECGTTESGYEFAIEELADACEMFAMAFKETLAPVLYNLTKKIKEATEELEFGDVFDE